MGSGFPLFGMLDSLSTEEYREWFNTEEGRQFFPNGTLWGPSCDRGEMLALQASLAEGRSLVPVASRGVSWEPPVHLATDVFASGSAVHLARSAADTSEGCVHGEAAALLVW